MRLGISSYTFVWAAGVPGYELPRAPLTHEQLLRRAVDLGVKVVQIADNMPLERLSAREIDRLARLAGELGLSLEVGTCGFDPSHLLNHLELAARLGSPILRVVMDQEGVHVTGDQAVGVLKQVLPAFQEKQVGLAIENHDRLSARTLAQVIERAGGRGVGICLDTANSLGCGEDVWTVFRTLSPWILNVHVKDFVARRHPHNKGFVIDGCPAGQGVLEIPELIASLQRSPNDPNVILELWPAPEATIDASIAKEEAWTRQSIRFLRNYVLE